MNEQNTKIIAMIYQEVINRGQRKFQSQAEVLFYFPLLYKPRLQAGLPGIQAW